MRISILLQFSLVKIEQWKIIETRQKTRQVHNSTHKIIAHNEKLIVFMY
jgi:hypothetical protein